MSIRTFYTVDEMIQLDFEGVAKPAGKGVHHGFPQGADVRVLDVRPLSGVSGGTHAQRAKQLQGTAEGLTYCLTY